MAVPEQARWEAVEQKSSNSAWTLLALFLAALGIVFVFSKTGNAQMGDKLRNTSPPESPIITPTPIPTVSPLPSPPPITEDVSPSIGVMGSPHQINVYGNYFQRKAVVRIVWESDEKSARTGQTTDYTSLNTTFVSSGQLVARIPANIAKGLYGLQVVNPDAQESPVLHTAYEAVSANPLETDDIKSRGGNLWTTPNTLTAGETASIGLTVFRIGGVGGLPPFAVDFYAGEVDAGHLIGRGFVPGISPDSSASTSAVTWTPTDYGEVKLIAVIDPDGQITESNENNNTVRRTIDVRYIQTADATPPLAQRLFVNEGQQQVSDQNVSLRIDAVDPDPDPSGVSKSYYVELHWASGVGNGGAWIPVKWTNWNDYGSQPHAYEMMPNSGVRYLQGWVADGSGNISAKPATQRVNYVPATDTLLEGEIRVYRPATLAGQCLRVSVQPADATSDPDLYVWPPNHTQGSVPAGYSILGAGEVDEVVIQPTVGGVYQVEILAYTDATFNQTIEVLDSCATSRSSTSPTSPTDKQPRTDPSVPVEDEPVGTEAAPETIRQFLSFISITFQDTESAGANKTIYLPSLNR